MQSFSSYLAEAFVNLLPHHEDQKHAHKKEVFDLVQKAYESQGGIHGNGFKSPDDMVKNIHMWKMHKKDGKVKAVTLYKDSGNGRKRVAVATDGSDEGKTAASKMMTDDFTRSRAHAEVSGKSLSFLKKHVNVKDHAHSFEYAKAYHAKAGDHVERPADDDPEVVRHPELKDHFYVRKIGGQNHTKLMMGAVGKNIK